MHKVLVIIGSLRPGSINRRFALALEKLASERMAFTYADVADLPIYNEDLWADPPTAVLALKGQVKAYDAVLLVTPEYNRSIPPVMKNAIDWGSRPPSDNAWLDKPCAILGATPGAIGTAVAQSHLRHVAVAVGMVVMGKPEIYYSMKPDAIGEDHAFTDPKTREVMAKFLAAFDRWIVRLKN